MLTYNTDRGSSYRCTRIEWSCWSGGFVRFITARDEQYRGRELHGTAQRCTIVFS